jgi:two-component system phosphate regulon sensor histidine kinase PhoR
MKRIFTKIFFGYLLVIIVLTLPILYFSFNTISENYQRNLIQSQINISHTIDINIQPLLLSRNFVKLDSDIKDLGNQINSRITIIDKNGVVIADSKANPNSMDNHADRPEVVKALQSGLGTSVRHSYTINQDMMYVATPLRVNNALFGVTRLSIFMEDYSNLIDSLEYKILEIVLFVGVISCLLAFFLSRTLTKPIIILAKASKDVANGNFTIRTNVKTNDELELLGESFNNMIERLESLFNQTNSQKDELNKIISSIQEGLVVIDNNGLIILSNDSFKLITGYEVLIGKHYWEVIRDNQANKTIKKMIESDINITAEIELKNDFFICSANHINDKSELVLIFNNISELKKLEYIKRDFVVNVSHELRTPLTVIKGYIETIEDDIDEKNKKFISIIKNHTNRLINIVQDLLTVSQLEDINVKLDISDIDLDSFFVNLNNTFEQKLKTKNITLSIDYNNNIHGFKADAFKLEQMFINLIDNAIKYTEKGSIQISASPESDHVKFDISDTGIGIPIKDQDRIFERFYTVDKSRSRQLAGTGLGLSIVKHIVNLHRGKISLDSEIDKGSRFTVLLPYSSTLNG